MRLSVALCTYNGERFLQEQLDSIAAQTRLPDELVVSDDRSTDGTRQIVESFAAAAPFRVKLHVNEVNVGSSRNFDNAVRLCEGDVIALCDQDDVWLPEKLGRTEEVFAADADAGLVFGDAEVVGEDLSPTGRRLWDWTFTTAVQREMRRDAFLTLLRHNVVTGATTAFRARLKPLALPIPADLNMIHDGWIALVAAAVSRVVPLHEPLIKYRRHGGQQLGVSSASGLNGSGGRFAFDDSLAGRAGYYDGEIRKVERLADRLRQAAAGGAWPASLGERVGTLEEVAAHYRVRGNTQSGKFARLPAVLRELLTMRYHRYSNGLSSAALDLIR
ncbi:MAG TPA: glycosyltransferase family 2 protein [Pyrinomonadaceae bacterium]